MVGEEGRYGNDYNVKIKSINKNYFFKTRMSIFPSPESKSASAPLGHSLVLIFWGHTAGLSPFHLPILQIFKNCSNSSPESSLLQNEHACCPQPNLCFLVLGCPHLDMTSIFTTALQTGSDQDRGGWAITTFCLDFIFFISTNTTLAASAVKSPCWLMSPLWLTKALPSSQRNYCKPRVFSSFSPTHFPSYTCAVDFLNIKVRLHIYPY